MNKRYAGIYMGMAMTALSSTAMATDVMEVEINHPISKAQYLAIPADPVTISAKLGDGYSADIDYYTFSGKAGDVVDVDIDHGYAPPTSYLDTLIAIFDAAPNYRVLRMNDDSRPIDEGSTSAVDSRIVGFVLPTTGEYVVGVTNYPRRFVNGGSVVGTTARTGTYTLVISGVSPSVLQVAIDIKPGSDIAAVNPKSRGKVPVALLSGPSFDPAMVDVTSLTFGSTGNESSLDKCHADGEDRNADGIADIVCQFENQIANFKASDAEGILRGRTSDGRAIEGRGFLKVIPVKSSHE